MNFFEHQARARSHSQRLILLFALAVISIVVAIDVVAVIAVDASGVHPRGTPLLSLHAALPTILATSFCVLAVIGLASLYRIASLSGGGAKVAQSLGAVFISPDTVNPRYRRLRNVIEEIAIASGVPVPQIFVLEQEPGINAFAAGYSPSDAAVTVTRGAMEKLSRDELQGVIAHEFSHILNGDMRINIRIMGLIFGILALSVIGRQFLNWGPRGRSNDRGGNVLFFIALSVLAFGSIGVFFGRLIKANLSRQREYLADASAVQFTRQTLGISGALKKASGLDAGTRFQSVHGEEVAHMLFGDGVGYSMLFATHPPMVDRIRRLEPQFDPGTIAQSAVAWNDPGYVPDDDAHPEVMSNFAAGGQRAVVPAVVIAQVAAPGEDDYRVAMSLHRAIPEIWRTAARDDIRAADAVLALLLDPDADIRGRQLQAIEADWGAARREGTMALFEHIDELHRVQRLPLAAMALPALRQRTRDDLVRFMRTLWALVLADGRVQIFEYCLGRLVRNQIAESLMPASASGPGKLTLADCGESIVLLLAVLAEQGENDEKLSRQAFLIGVQHVLPNARSGFEPVTTFPEWPKKLEAALKQLDGLQPAGKQVLIEGMVEVLSADGKVTYAEAELLRVVCGALHCPLPPFLQEAA